MVGRIAVVGVVLVALLGLGVAEAAPGNDDFAGRTVIGALPFTETVDTTDATVEPDEARCVGNASVWYEISPQQEIPLVFDTAGSSYNTYITLFRQSASDPVERPSDQHREHCVGSFEGTPARLTAVLEPDWRYSISITTVDETAGTLVVSATLGQPPANDDIADAIEITSLPFETTANTGFASRESGEPDYCRSPDPAFPSTASFTASVWYRYRSAEKTIVHLEVPYGAAVWSGPSPQNLRLVDCGPVITFDAIAGTQYFVQVARERAPTVDARLSAMPWREVVLASESKLTVIPSQAGVIRVAGSPRDDQSGFYDLTFESPAGNRSMGINVFGTVAQSFDLAFPAGLAIERLNVLMWFDPSDRQCLADGGGGTPCNAYLPPSQRLSRPYGEFLVIDLSGRYGNQPFDERVRIPLVGVIGVVEPSA